MFAALIVLSACVHHAAAVSIKIGRTNSVRMCRLQRRISCIVSVQHDTPHFHQLSRNQTFSDRPAGLGSSVPLFGGYVNLQLSYVTLQLGTPPQSVNLHLDTGSATLGVFSTACPTAQCNADGQEHLYDMAQSSTAAGGACSFRVCMHVCAFVQHFIYIDFINLPSRDASPMRRSAMPRRGHSDEPGVPIGARTNCNLVAVCISRVLR